jgi:hypothetical protein
MEMRYRDSRDTVGISGDAGDERYGGDTVEISRDAGDERYSGDYGLLRCRNACHSPLYGDSKLLKSLCWAPANYQVPGKVYLLPLRSLSIIGSGVHQPSKVSDTVDMVAWEEDLAELGEVKPLEGGIFDSSIVEIEAIYVNVCFHCLSLKINKGHPKVASALPPKQQG